MSVILMLIKNGRTFVLRCRSKGEDMKTHEKNPEWNELIIREPTEEERMLCGRRDHFFVVENLPGLGEEVLVTNGEEIWIDSFAEDERLYLSFTERKVDEVTSWMPLPEPYTGE